MRAVAIGGGPAGLYFGILVKKLLPGAAVRILERNRPDYDIPTTGALVGNEIFYVASSQLGRFNEDKTIFPADKLVESAIVKTPLQIPCK